MPAFDWLPCVHAAIVASCLLGAPAGRAASAPAPDVDRAVTPTRSASTRTTHAPGRPRAFDLEAARYVARMAGKETASGTRSPMERLPTYRDGDRLRQGIERAQRGDCRTEYAGMGLLAVAPLLVDGISGKGCTFK